MSELTLWNTLTRKKEKLVPLCGNTIRMYTCGPTVYNYAHIGNFRTYVFEDLLRRVICFFGMGINQAMNLTDVDDKTIKGALSQNVSLDAFTKTYKQAFFDDIKTLGIQKVEHYPEATQYIQEMITLIEKLLEKGVAYRDELGNVYFSIKRFPEYGKLAHLKLDDLLVGASERVFIDEYEKDTASDFVLWKAYDKERDGDVFWQSPFGEGRPGWHIECSAMAMELLGESIDIHVGGVDNMFPHHENEIAQCEACTGKTFAKHWLHCEHLLVNNKKMSKSLGNFFTLRDLLDKGYSGPVIRFSLLSVHYRSQLNFTIETLDACKASFQRLSDFIDRLRHADGNGQGSILIEDIARKFKSALADDLNISEALAAVFECVREGNTLMDKGLIGQKESKQILSFLEKINEVLGFLPLNQAAERIDQDLEEALCSREKARAEKNWIDADKWRDFLLERGYLIEDTPHGPRLKKR